MTNQTKEREEEEGKVISGAPSNKDRKGRPLAGEPAPADPRADSYGTRHLMEEEMKKTAAKEGAADAARPDQGLPEEGEEGEEKLDQGRGSPGRRR